MFVHVRNDSQIAIWCPSTNNSFTLKFIHKISNGKNYWEINPCHYSQHIKEFIWSLVHFE